jgi:8-oxo-dGTP pyrophosphatase MutT (NUDIX family)
MILIDAWASKKSRRPSISGLGINLHGRSAGWRDRTFIALRYPDGKKSEMVPSLKAAGVLLFRRQPGWQFLLMKHRDRWDLPKGHLDSGETWKQAARRELREETGIDPKEVDFAPGFRFDLRYTVTYHAQVYDKQVVYFLAYWPKDGMLRVTEHAGYQWWDWKPPHRIQPQTIDPLLESVATYLSSPQAIRWLASTHPASDG